MRKDDPKTNPYSLGNLLLSAGHCTEADIEEALKHADELMGEYMVKRGLITREILELMLAKQQAARGGNGAVISFAQLAVKRTRAVAERTLDSLDSIDTLALNKGK